VAKIEIINCTKESSGTYKVQFKNEYGVVESEATLIVEGKENLLLLVY